VNEVFTFLGVFSHSHTYLVVSHTILVALIVLGIAKLATSSMQIVPKGVQNIAESYLGGVISMGKDVIGEDLAKHYLPLVATIGLVVFVANMVGIIPGFESPTSNINFTLALALIVFIYYNYEGIKKQGPVNYIKSFVHLGEMNPIAKFAMSIFMYPIEIVSHLSRIVSLSFRLFGNIKGDDLFLAVMLMLAPFIAPLAPFALLTFSGLLQAFIFMILTYVYLAGAVQVSDEH
jgi:F-type H+-transporting ATPase subunit a